MSAGLKNFRFLLPHLPEFEGELQDLLLEIDKLIERKKGEWENELKSLEHQLNQKMEENQKLQEKITLKEKELETAFETIQNFERKIWNGDSEKKLDDLKSSVNWMIKNYEITQKKFQKKLIFEREQNARTLKIFEEDKSHLLSELSSLREDKRKQTELFSMQLKEEKVANVKLKAHCDELQVQLQTITNELEDQRSKYIQLQSSYNSRQSEWDSLLKDVNKTAAAQAKELARTKQLLINKQTELRRLSSDAFSRQSELMASRDVVQRLEAAVTRHLSIFSSERNLDDPALSSTMFNCTQPLNNLFGAEFDDKLCKLEQKLNESHHTVRNKIKEIGQLETACRTASATIQRLVEAKLYAVNQAAALRSTLKKTLRAVEELDERINKLQGTVRIKMDETTSKLKYLRKLVIQGSLQQAMGNKPSSGCSISTQVSPVMECEETQTNCSFLTSSSVWSSSKVQLVREERMCTVQKLQRRIDALTEERSGLQTRLEHQTSLVEKLQKENLALTDLLTDAERFNRTRIPCATELPTEIRARLPVDMCPSGLNIPSKVAGDEHCLESRHGSPQCSARSITIQSPIDCIPELFNNAQLVGISLCTPSSESNPLPISPIQSCSKSVCDSTSKSRIDRPLFSSVAMPMTDTKSIVETGDHLLVGHASTECDPGQALHLSGASMSPSEYEDFVMPNSDRLCVPDRFEQYGDCLRVSRPLSDRTPEKASLFDSSMNNETKLKQLPLRNSPSSPAMNSTELVSTWCHNHRVFPQACSTVHKDTTQSFRMASDDEEEDTNVYCLAAKFLANEQQHSLRLETQIDIHLEELRKQLEHSSSTT
ncbi:hypothetical protein EG68_03591 [Paragonimus skrjabini miyazakii]|uniref:Uncharacterized protein n=1 Tax=Paragonimus skrjabini miyazakii TaxID=59628 RepID=A0A8S9Z048_9TREM|nr:hypothetical protein EG68_03591 [Paragonimus skrjabini miyazakii]